MKCIICGNEIEAILEPNPEMEPTMLIVGYKCNSCNLQWTLAEHKDNQNWAVRHIRILEKQIAELNSVEENISETEIVTDINDRITKLEQAMDKLLQKLGV